MVAKYASVPEKCFGDGVCHGKGTYHYKNGDRYEGTWENKANVGRVTYYYTDGKAETGAYVNGKWVPDRN